MIATIGILGGGQLGRMLTLEAKRMGYRVVTLEPSADSPCGQVADEQIVAAYDDPPRSRELGARSDVVTYEFENIPLDSVTVARTRRAARASERRRLAHHAGPHPGEDVRAGPRLRDGRVRRRDRRGGIARGAANAIGFPAVLKTVRGGYDGKGQWIVQRRSNRRAPRSQRPAAATLICEQFIPFERELSIICARNARGETAAFPVTENVHDHGVLDDDDRAGAHSERARRRPRPRAGARHRRRARASSAPTASSSSVAATASFVNEIAPRVHNSGHYSLDATQISQYEAHVRAICDLPLVEPRQFAPAVMMNILGAGTGDHLAGVAEMLRDPDLKLHIYGKRHAALRRKMGHFTVLAPTVDAALVRARAARAHLSWTGEPVSPERTASAVSR